MSEIKVEELQEIVAFAEGRADSGLSFAEISEMWSRIKRLAQAELERRESLPSNLIQHAVDKFLGWKLPADFNPDGGIVFDKMSARKLHPQNHIHEPSGTNLFTADQAKAMFEYCLAGAALSAPVQPKSCAWVADEDGVYDTTCGNRYCIFEGTPQENDMAFCCYCGGSIPSQPTAKEAKDEHHE